MLTRLKSIGPVAYYLIGILAAIVGLLPWIITGMRLPLQNLWATAALSAEMPVALLPFSQYYVTTIVALIVVGSAIAGVFARATRTHHPRRALTALVLGVLTVQVIATVQTAVTVSNGLATRTAATHYLVGLTAGIALSIALAIGVLLLIAKAPRAGATIALSITALALGSWLSALIAPIGTYAGDVNMSALSLVRWVPAVAVGLAIVWCGVSSIGRIIAVIASLLILWVGTALETAVTASLGSRVLLPYPAELLDYAVGVFRMALVVEGAAISLLPVAITVAVVGLVVRWAVERRVRT